MFARREKPSLLERARQFLFPRGGLKRAWAYIWHRTKRISASPYMIAAGFAAGAFVSFTPFIGFHFILAGILAFFLRGSILASALGTAVGNPLTFPFIWWATYNVGGFLLGYDLKGEIHIHLPDGTMMLLFSDPARFWDVFWGALGPIILPMLVGAFPVGGPVALALYFLVYKGVASYQEHRRTLLSERRRQLEQLAELAG